MAFFAVIVAAGKGSRSGSPKQFIELCGHSVLWHSVQPFLRNSRIDMVRVVIAADMAETAAACLVGLPKKVLPLSVGGRTRRESVQNGLCGMDDDDWVLVHDAARPCLSDAALTRLLDHASTDTVGGLLACPMVDCLKQTDGSRTQQTLPRDDKWLAQTPQMFRVEPLRKALALAGEGDDEAQAMELAGHAPLLVEGETTNIKITRAEDFILASAILAARE
ncbi:2-C-methyl-D-erythritol 4-phosphate cytidylyltransferase [Candidatus Persebacteraceae bacterium Df01]|jgi:2-C-methyl-D-erythritol 4-phosphate cytidylyltransferase|uniref:2-C-methyl-D-erythritol 4-phosphate cytidylyltransferase n=1 Tax=Candidatus Doriopsillibacter californiensis TaxID=2970740 RepID=A0ABT7QMG9_9GAMM|nr:2-C-methyl-D-erythritol 4-phosphate cytidylyltransferase [Candidatus Persebacteraceae bacterium Df01]